MVQFEAVRALYVCGVDTRVLNSHVWGGAVISRLSGTRNYVLRVACASMLYMPVLQRKPLLLTRANYLRRMARIYLYHGWATSTSLQRTPPFAWMLIYGTKGSCTLARATWSAWPNTLNPFLVASSILPNVTLAYKGVLNDNHLALILGRAVPHQMQLFASYSNIPLLANAFHLTCAVH